MVGFIGLGNMGAPMARNLLKHGFQLTFFARRREQVEEFAASGAHPAASPAEVARASDVVFLSLSSPEASWEVLDGKAGILSGANPGLIVIDLSTISPAQARAMAERANQRGVMFLDAGVAGGQPNAQKGTLTIMVGGPQPAYEQALGCLRAIGEHIYYVGPSGTGMVTKLVNNAIAHVNVVAAIEGMALGVKAGVPAQVLAEVISRGSGASYQFQGRIINRLLKRNFSPGMKLGLTFKDSRLACDLANEAGVPMFVTAAAHAVYQHAMNLGVQELDYAVVAQIWEDSLGVVFES